MPFDSCKNLDVLVYLFLRLHNLFLLAFYSYASWGILDYSSHYQLLSNDIYTLKTSKIAFTIFKFLFEIDNDKIMAEPSFYHFKIGMVLPKLKDFLLALIQN
jgi:hypothetical protein